MLYKHMSMVPLQDRVDLPAIHADKYESIGTLSSWGIEAPQGGLQGNPFVFYQELKTFTQRVLERVKLLLLQRLESLAVMDSVCILTTGSDGRGEKGESSKMALVIVYDSLSGPLSLEFKGVISSLEREFSDVFERNTEYQDLAKEQTLFRVYEDKEARFFPTRSLDSIFLVGNLKLFELYKGRYCTEVTRASTGLIRRFKKSCVKAAESVLQTGMSRGEVVFSPLKLKNKVMLRYSLSKDLHICATKYGHLRLVQYHVNALINGAIRKNKITPDNVRNLPRSIPDRLVFMIELGLINDRLCYDNRFVSVRKDVIPAYRKALLIYFSLADIFHKGEGVGDEGVNVLVNAEEFDHMTLSIRAFAGCSLSEVRVGDAF